MQEDLKQIWINAVNEDFPEFAITMNRLDKKIELHAELIEDYYVCKQQIKILEKSNKNSLLTKYIIVLEDLREEIRQMLAEIKITPYDKV